MLLMKPNCEGCGCNLPPDSRLATICSFECTFCERCAVRLGACPNCGGQLLRRPIRPGAYDEPGRWSTASAAASSPGSEPH